MWFPNRSDTNQAVQSQKQARSLKFRIEVEEELYGGHSRINDNDSIKLYSKHLCAFHKLSTKFEDVCYITAPSKVRYDAGSVVARQPKNTR